MTPGRHKCEIEKVYDFSKFRQRRKIYFWRMNGPAAIYRIKPIVKHDVIINLPKCMYRIKNIHATRNGVGPLDGHVKPRKNLDISEQVKLFLKVFIYFFCSTRFRNHRYILISTHMCTLTILFPKFNCMTHWTYQFLWTTVKALMKSVEERSYPHHGS